MSASRKKPIITRHRQRGRIVERVRIKFADDCKPCPNCGEPFCEQCQAHYADCQCIRPSSAEDEGWKLVERRGVLYGERIAAPEI